MTQEPRKATDVLLDLESKVETLLGVVRAQDLNIKVLSNKLNDVLSRLDKQQSGPPKIIVETVQTPPHPAIVSVVDPERNIQFSTDGKLPQTAAPDGFRRNSRPETYVDSKKAQPIQPPQLPPARPKAGNPPPGRGPGSDVATVILPPVVQKKGSGAVMAPQAPPIQPHLMDEPPSPSPPSPSSQDQIPVTQRCVDKNGKAIFLADVEIIDLSTGQVIFKTRTNGTGKWMASLGIGAYRVTIRKRESVNKEKIEAIQDIQVDGSSSRLELPMLLVK